MPRDFWQRVTSLKARVGLQRLLRYAFEAALVHLLYGLFRLLPLDAASFLGGRAMRALGPLLRRTKTTVLPQLASALPDKSAAERDAIMRDVWENMGRTFAEYAHLDHIYQRVTVVGAEHLAAARGIDRPVIFVAAHVANWEIAAIVVKQSGIPLYGVHRAPNNPWVEGLIERARRTGAGERLIAKGAAGARQILSVMRQNEAIGILVDQRLSGGVPVQFFGRPALTAPAVALFARKYKAQVHYARVERLEGAHFRVTISPAIEVPDDETVFLQDINDELEHWVRDRPGQWLWTHRRWKI